MMVNVAGINSYNGVCCNPGPANNSAIFGSRKNRMSWETDHTKGNLFYLFLEKCEAPKYDVKILTWGLNDLSLYPKAKIDRIKNEKWLFIYFDKTDVVYYQQIPILSIWSFISSAGGSIGLFLGFSCYSVLSYCNDYLQQKCQ